MDSPIPPDPYQALGVTKDADPDTIKKAYRKLALKLHPDKCTDESQKAARTDEFTKIQQAYDIIGDEEKKGRYDAQVRLAELRRQNMELRSGAGLRGDTKYNVRESVPRDVPRGSTYSSRAPPMARAYEHAPPPQPRARAYDDGDYVPYSGATRKTSGADEYAYRRPAAPREERREKPRPATAVREEEKRRDAKRREAEIRDSRSAKFERDDYDERDRRRTRDRDYDDMRRRDAGVSDSYGSSTERITEDRMREAQRHMNRTERPTMSRRESSRQVPTYSREESDPRRSAAPPKEKERRRASPGKDDRRRENIDPYTSRRVPNLSTQSSAPPNLESMPPPQPHRSYTTPDVYESKKKQASGSPPPPPPLARSSTQPEASSSNRRKETRGRAVPEDSGYSSPTVTPGYSATKSYGDEPAAPHHSYSNGHRTVLREPTSSSRRAATSPARPSPGAAKMASLASAGSKPIKRTQHYYPDPIPVIETREPKPSTRRPREVEHERDYTEYERSRPQYFGEHGAGTTDPRFSQPTSPYEHVNYPHRSGPHERQYRYDRPNLSRGQTVY